MAGKPKGQHDEVSEILETAQKALYAYADFEVRGVTFKAGERFVPAPGWTRDLRMDELLSGSKVKNKKHVGMAFSYQGVVVNPGEKNPDLRERRVYTAVLPLEER